MATFITEPSDYISHSIPDTGMLLKSSKLNEFKSDLLGLGQISKTAKATSCIAAVFDLQGFTNFCNQIDPQLAIPDFLGDFLPWIFEQIKQEQIEKTADQGAHLYAPLPFYAKFLGDGLLFLWDTKNFEYQSIINTVAICEAICDNYKSTFYPRISKRFVSPPPLLRCGVARGVVLSVGDNNDFVGSCINMAARLQKLGSTLTFAFNIRGVIWDDEKIRYVNHPISTVRTEIRGIGTGELIAVRTAELKELPSDERGKFTVVHEYL